MTSAAAIEAAVNEELRDEMQAITRDLLEAAAADAPTLPPEEHAERHPGLEPLQESGYTSVKAAAGRVIGRVGFKAFYAAWVEERRDYKHDDGKAGYLGDNLKAIVPEIRERLAGAARRGIERAKREG